MANVEHELQVLAAAKYGEEVRSAIIDAITAMNTESTAAESAAISAQNSATASASAASTSESNAASSASAASTSESNAASSASAASTSATNAATSESNAASSASVASTSESNASSSASAAATSATNASTSESNAASSASAAAQSARDALSYATNASNSASAASSSADAASTSATNAATSAGAASTSATNAASSASAASTSETNAASSASDAATSATDAANSATAAADSATAAAASATQADGTFLYIQITDSTKASARTSGETRIDYDHIYDKDGNTLDATGWMTAFQKGESLFVKYIWKNDDNSTTPKWFPLAAVYEKTINSTTYTVFQFKYQDPTSALIDGKTMCIYYYIYPRTSPGGSTVYNTYSVFIGVENPIGGGGGGLEIVTISDDSNPISELAVNAYGTYTVSASRADVIDMLNAGERVAVKSWDSVYGYTSPISSWGFYSNEIYFTIGAKVYSAHGGGEPNLWEVTRIA